MKKFYNKYLNKALVIVIYILMFYVFSLVLKDIFTKFVTNEETAIIYTILINVIVDVTVFTAGILLLGKELLSDFQVLKKTNAMFTFKHCAMFVGFVYAGNIAGSIISSILGGNDSSVNQQSIEYILFSKYGIFMILIIVVIGPILEELVFRKAIHKFLDNFKLPNWLIVLISSVLFGLIHVASAGDFIYIFSYLFMGVALGTLERITKNIYPSIIVHMFINGMATALLILLNKLTKFLPDMG